MTTFITVTEMVCCYDHLSTNLHIPQKECEVYEELLLKHLRPYCTTTSMDEDGIDVEDAHNTIDEVCNTKAHLRNIVGGMEELLAVLRTHEEHTLQTLRYIALREDVMERLRVCCEFFDGGGCVLDDAQANFLLLLQEHQMLTLLVVESITQWQLTLRYAAPFVWRCGGGGGAELYMHRILADCAALTYTNVCKSLQIRLTQQPLCANMHLQQVAHRKMLMRRTKMVNSGALWSKGLQPVVPPVHDGVRRYYDVLCCFSGPLAAKNLRDARHGSMAIRHAPTHDADAVDDDDDDDGVVGVAPPLLHGWRPSKNHMARKRKHERLAHAEELLLQEPARVEQMQAELHMLEHTCGGIAMLLATDDLIHVRAESSSVHTNTDTFPRTFTANTSMWSLNEELCNHIYVARHGRGRGRREQQSQSQHRDVVHEAATRSMVSASATPTTNSATNNTRRSSITSSSSSSIVASSSTTSATLPDAPTPTTTTTTKAADVRRGSLSSSSLLSSSLSANTSTKMEEDVPPPEHPNTARVAASHPSSRASSSSSRTSSLSHTKTPLSFISSSTQSPAPSSPASSARGETNVVEERRSISLEELRRQLLEEHSQSM